MAENQDKGSDPKGCCDTETDFLKTEYEQSLLEVASSSSFELHALLPASGISLGFYPHVADTKTRHYFNYKPPLIVCDLALSFQTFLC